MSGRRPLPTLKIDRSDTQTALCPPDRHKSTQLRRRRPASTSLRNRLVRQAVAGRTEAAAVVGEEDISGTAKASPVPDASGTPAGSRTRPGAAARPSASSTETERADNRPTQVP